MKYTSILILSIFSFFINNRLSAKNLPIPGCEIPLNLNYITIDYDSISISWDAGSQTSLPEKYEVRYRSLTQYGLGYWTNEFVLKPRYHNNFTLNYLDWNTKYQIQVRSICRDGNHPNGNPRYLESDWVDLFLKTSAYKPDECSNSDSTTFSFSNIDYDRFTLNWMSNNLQNVDMCSRRFFVKLKNVSTGVEQTRIVSTDNFPIDELSPSTNYHVWIREIFDGCGEEFWMACDWKGPYSLTTKDKASLCNSFNAWVRCIGVDNIMIKFTPISFIPGQLNSANIEKNLRVKIRYREQGTHNWNEVIVLKGDNYYLEWLNRSTTYELEAALIKGDGSIVSCNYISLGTHTTLMTPEADNDGDGIPNSCDDTPNFKNEDNDESVQRSVGCGIQGDTTIPNGNNLQRYLFSFAEITIRGLPIKVIAATGEYTFSGTGSLSLPFGGKIVLVRFSDIQVDQFSKKIVSGTVNGEVDPNEFMPNFEHPIVYEEGEDINDKNSSSYDSFCNVNNDEFDDEGNYKTPGGGVIKTNPKGFNQSGYAKAPYDKGPNNPQPYDPNRDPYGYDKDGNYLDGSKTNPEGCTQEDYLDTTSTCFKNKKAPYFWLNENKNPTEWGIKLVQNISKEVLLAQLDCALSAQKDSTVQDKNKKINECQIIRDTIKDIMTKLGHTDELIFSTNKNEYLNAGMSKNFISKPEPVDPKYSRNPLQTLLEARHIDLYICDVEQEKITEEEATLDEKDKPELKEQLELEIKNKLLTLPDDDAKALDSLIKINPSALCDWMKTKLKDIIKNKNGDNANFGMFKAIDEPLDVEPIKYFLPSNSINFERYENSYGLIADNTKNIITIEENRLKIEEQRKINENILSELKNGATKINGIDAAFYWEALFKQRDIKNQLLTNSPQKLPIKLSQNILGVQYDIYITKLDATPISTTIDAFIILRMVPSKKRVIFRATNIKFNPDGFEEVQLGLADTVSLPINNVMRVNLFPNGTYVKFKCNGFGGLKINSSLEICRKYLTPLDENNKPLPEPQMLNAAFSVEMPAWGEFMVNLSLGRFAISGNEQMPWNVSNIWFDFSDQNSPPNMQLPSNYYSPFKMGSTLNPRWKGIFIDAIEVQVSNDFKDNGHSTTIGVNKVIIDDGGLTATAKVSPVLSLDDGRIGKWAFSIDTFKLAVCRNTFAGMGIIGKIQLPLFDDKDTLSYVASIQKNGDYSFSVGIKQDMQIPMLKSGFKLTSGAVTIKKKNGIFEATATISGEINTDKVFGGIPIKLNKVSFSDLELKTVSPYFSPGTWSNLDSISAGVNFGGFEFNIGNVHPTEGLNNKELVGVGFKISLKLGDDAHNLKVTGGFNLLGKLNEINGRHKWEYENIELTDACVDGSFPAVKNIKGCIAFFNNDSLGKGFFGELSMGIPAIGLDEIKVAGMFGKKEDYKYFFLDALAVLTNGIGGGGFKLKAFGGGVYKNMVMSPLSSLPQNINPFPNKLVIGKSVSGAIYTPQRDKLGISAMIGFTGDIEKTYNGVLILSVQFNTGPSSGIEFIKLDGIARFMSEFKMDINPNDTTTKVPVLAFASITYNFTESSLHGNFDAKVDVLDGSIKGYGHAEIHVSNKGWWFYVGTPNDPVWVKLSLLGVNIATTEFYLDIGSKLPADKPLPSYVEKIVQLGNNDNPSAGGGFMFGMAIKLGNQDEKKFLIFYARLYLEFGFDLSLRDYGNTYCSNTGDKIGIDGWYARGQAYAYVRATIGIDAKVFGVRRKFNIMDLAAAAAVRMEFPNPFYAKGAIGGEYEILGGLISGYCRIKFTIGEKCQMVDPSGNPINEPDEIGLIDYVTPEGSPRTLEQGDIPMIHFNMQFNEEISSHDDDGNFEFWNFSELAVNLYGINNSNNFSINTGYEKNKPYVTNWSGNRKSLYVDAGYEIPAGSYKLEVISTIIIKDGSYAFKRTIDNIDTFTIVIKGSNDKINDNDILSSVPFKNQYNFYKKYYKDASSISKGYILLKRDKTKTLKTDQNIYYINFYDKLTGGQISGSKAIFIGKKILFDIPNSLVNGKTYDIKLQKLNFSLDESKIELDGFNTVYTYSFRVSKFNSLEEKLEKFKENLIITSSTEDLIITASKGNMEPFEDREFKNYIKFDLNWKYTDTIGIREQNEGILQLEKSKTLSRAIYMNFPDKYNFQVNGIIPCPLTWAKEMTKYYDFKKNTTFFGPNWKYIEQNTIKFISSNNEPIELNPNNYFNENFSEPQSIRFSLLNFVKKDYDLLKKYNCTCFKNTDGEAIYNDHINNQLDYPLPNSNSNLDFYLYYNIPIINDSESGFNYRYKLSVKYN